VVERIKGWLRRDAPPSGTERQMASIRLLTLEWYVAGHVAMDLAARFLDATQAVDPRALPRRFAGGEPERGTPATGAAGRSAFESAWLAPRMLNWTTGRPYLGGHLSPPPDAPQANRARRHTLIKLYVNATSIEPELDACDTVVGLFASIAVATNAFFGAGYVERRHALDGRGKLWSVGDTESIPWIHGAWWDGLPSTPTWLSWFGRPYAPLVEDSLDGRAVAHGEGLLLRNGPVPMHLEEVARLAPRLPRELVEVREPILAEHLSPGLTEPIVLDWGRLPASAIPDLHDPNRS
jgi:hypothetical protein